MDWKMETTQPVPAGILILSVLWLMVQSLLAQHTVSSRAWNLPINRTKIIQMCIPGIIPTRKDGGQMSLDLHQHCRSAQMRIELSSHPGARPHCPKVAASFAPTHCEQDGEGSWRHHVSTVSSAAAAASVSPFPGGLQGGFSRAWLVLSPWGGGYPVFSHFTHN